MKRILAPFLGARVGGSHTLAFTIAQALQRQGLAQTTIVAPGGSKIEEEARRYGLAFEQSGLAPRFRSNALIDVGAFAHRRATLGAYDILHCHDLSTLQAWGPAARAAGVRVVYHHQGLVKPYSPRRAATLLADHCVSVSEVCARNLNVGRKGTVIYNAFELHDHRGAAEEKRRLLDEAQVEAASPAIGFIGNFWTRKRPDYFLRACAAVAKRAPDARLFIFGEAGDISQSALAQQADALGISKNVYFAGFRTPAEANIAAMDVVAAPALREPFGRTLIEAAMLGVPYVATDDAGHHEIWARWKGGLLAPVSASSEIFADMLFEASQRPEDVVLNDAQRRALMDALSPAAIARQVNDVYNSVLRRS